MEKKTLTSFAIITFLMSSTAVVAMNEEVDRSAELTSGPAVQLKVAEEQDQPPSSSVPAVLTEEPAAEQTSGGGVFAFLNPLNYWPFTSTSTPSAISPIEETQVDSTNTIPSAAPAEESPTSIPSATPPGQQEEREGLTAFLATSMVLNADDPVFQQVLNAAAANGPDALEKAKQILNAAPTSTASSSAPTDPLVAEKEGFLTRWWNYLRAKPALTTEAQPMLEE